MFTRIKRTANQLCRSTSGNATMLVALGMPVLIGSAGLGVDMAQWYMWQRELQFAADQAAVAGAWARTDAQDADAFATRAQQEFDANISVVEDIAVTPTIQLANYATGIDNSVTVSVSASRRLPFSSFLTGNQATVTAFAQATFESGATFTSCLIAIDENEDGAITIAGDASLTAGCGMAALSSDPNAVIANGSPTVDAGWILARGGVDQWFKDNTDDIIMENMDGLFDPFGNVSPPNPAESQVSRTYSCSSTSGTTTADVTTVSHVSYDYFRGSSPSGADYYSYGSPKSDTSSTNTSYGQIVSSSTTAGTSTSSSVSWTQVSGSGQDKIWERRTTRISATYSNVVTTGGSLAGNVTPGTYSAIHVGCNTNFAPGVYIIDGGGIDISGQYEVSGSGVMFVLRNGAYLKIRGGANINLTAIQATDLTARGVPEEQANQLGGMLVFEDRDSEGSSRNEINGNASTVLNGTMYLPVSNMTFSGTASVTSQCLMIAANTITLTGTTNMSSFCPSGSQEDTTVATINGTVRLVA